MNDSNAVKRKLGVILSLFYTIAGIAAGFLFTPICTRMLGQGEYGVYSLVFSMVSYLGIFDLGFGAALIRYASQLRAEGKDPKNLYGLFLSLFAFLGIAVLAVGGVMYVNAGRFFGTGLTASEVDLLKSMFLLLLVNTALSFPTNVFSSIVQIHEEFVFFRLIAIANTILTPLVGTAFLLLGHGALRLIQVNVFFSVVGYAATVLFCFRRLHVRFGFARFPKAFYREIIVYCFYIFVDMLVSQIYDSTDQLILARFCSASAVAVYSIGVKFELYYQYLSASIANIYLPHISGLATQKNGLQEMNAILLRVGRLQFLMLSFVLCGFIVYGQEFMVLWAGEDYRDGYWIALLIMVPTLFTQAQTIGLAILKALNKHKVRSIMLFVIALFNIAISIPLSIRFEGIGAAMGTAIGYAIGQIGFMNWYYYKKIGLDIPACWKMYASILLRYVPVLTIFALTNLLHGDGWGMLIAKIALGVVLVIPYYLACVLNAEERKMILGKIRRD